MINTNNYYVFDFQFIDDDRCLRPLSESVDTGIGDESPEELKQKVEEIRESLKQMFTDVGWEGDGEINCIFVPPCLFGGEDGWTDIIYHVKQSNNGTSWLAIPKSMNLSLPTGIMVTR